MYSTTNNFDKAAPSRSSERLFELKTPLKPTGDQPQAIESIKTYLEEGVSNQTLMGVTGSGKTFTMACVIEKLQRPTLVIAHNKTLAAQLTSEFQEFFPNNAVHYFVSYYNYYQPEAYVPKTDTYIEKDSDINVEIERLRLATTRSLVTRKDTIVVASVSCIYGLGSPKEYKNAIFKIKLGDRLTPQKLARQLVSMQYDRNDVDLTNARFRLRGDTLEVVPADEETIVRVQFWGDEVEKIVRVENLTGRVIETVEEVSLFSAQHYVTSEETLKEALADVQEELYERLSYLKSKNKLLEAQRLEQRTNYDMEIIAETGTCPGIENYARHFDRRAQGTAPWTLLDYFPDNFLTYIDESHITLPQIRGMYYGDISRKSTLVDYGFRLPSALDNRPLAFDEFEERVGQMVFVSATPGPYEEEKERKRTEQVIRPTGLLDPTVKVVPTKNQIDDLLERIRQRKADKERVLVTTLTKRMAEDLTEYIAEMGVKVQYLHSDIATIDRTQILRDLRLGVYDVVVGINLLREGLDLPEVSLVAILDADKEGYLRSKTSLVQTIGRAARHERGTVVMYADNETISMRYALDETKRRREIQKEYNKKHSITPKTIVKTIRDITDKIAKSVVESSPNAKKVDLKDLKDVAESLSKAELRKYIKLIEKRMHQAARGLEFEKAAHLRDSIKELRLIELESSTTKKD